MVEGVTNFLFLGYKITVDGDCSREIKRRMLLGRKIMTNLDSVLKSRDITLPTKVRLVKAMVLPLVMYKCDFSSVQSLSHVQLFATPWTAACQASLFSTSSQSYSNSCPLSQWWHPTISSSVVSFSSLLQSFPASWSFPMSQFFASGGQVGVPTSASVLPMNIQDNYLRMDWLDFLVVQGTLKNLLQHHSSKAPTLRHSAFFIAHLSHPRFPCGSAGTESACSADTWVWPVGGEDPLEKGKATHSSILAWRIPSPWGLKELEMSQRLSLSHPYMTRGKTTALTRQTFAGKCESWTLKKTASKD